MKRVERFSDSAGKALREACVRIFAGEALKRGEQIYRGARNTLYKMTADAADADSPMLCVKHFRHAKFPNSYIYGRFRDSKAFRSYDYARRLKEAGFLTPEPIACCDNRRGLRLDDGYYVCSYLDLPNLRDWGNHPDGRLLIDALAREMLKFHSAGILHKDFSPGNILCDRRGPGDYSFYYVDLNRMRFGVTDRRKLMRMFRSISLNPDETRRLAESYARAAGLPEDEVVGEAVASLKSYLRTKARHRALKRVFKRKKS